MSEPFLVGIPTLNRYDLLTLALEDIFNSSIVPESVIIIDNGGDFKSDDKRVQIIRPRKNLGVSGSWNLLMKLSSPTQIVICNDDIRLDKESIEMLLSHEEDFIGTKDASWFTFFRIKHEAWEKVGPFDEAFFPAYYEDNDYYYRCKLAGISMQDFNVKISHAGSATIGKFSGHQRAEFNARFAACRQRYIEKWGGMPTDEKYILPFNGVDSTLILPDISRTRQAMFVHACLTPSDIFEHCQYLNQLAKECEHITELGVHQGNSTMAFLQAQPKKLVCYAKPKPRVISILDLLKENTEFVFHESGSLEMQIEETDLLFIDTLHTYDNLISELQLHSGKVRKYIIVHDTVTFGQRGEGGQPGIWPAIVKFLEEKKFKLLKHFENNNGLTVLEKI